MPAARSVQGTRALRRDHLDRVAPGLQMTKADKDYYLKCETYCDWLWKLLCFDAKERILPCCAGSLAHFENDLIMGNAFETDKKDYDQFNLEKLINMRKNVNQNSCCISCEGREHVNYDNFLLNRDLKEYTFLYHINK